MATFLDLCQSVARESRTVSGNRPLSVEGQSGRLDKIVHWTAQAWKDIQMDRRNWRFMEKTFTGPVLGGLAEYSGSDLNAADLATWLSGQNPKTGRPYVTIHSVAEGRAAERDLPYRDYDEIEASLLRGAASVQTGQPTIYGIRNDNKLVLHPTPDGDYTLRGRYICAPQELKQDADVPIMPDRFHNVIVWRALLSMAAHDESVTQPQFWQTRYDDLLGDLERDQLPKWSLGGPLV